jgi:hypothetical protein
MKKFSLVLSSLLAFGLVGCGNDDNTSTTPNVPNINKNISSVEVSEIKVGSNKAVVSPTSTEVVSNQYVYTKNNLGIVALQKISTPKKLNGDFNNSDSALNSVIQNNTSPYVLGEKVVPKPIISEDGNIITLFNFNPKNPFDVTVSVTDYKSLLSLPYAYEILKNKQIPLTDVSGDIAFFDSNGNRIWDINKRYKDKNTTVNITILLSHDIVKEKNLTEGKYSLYTIKNGELSFVKNINLTKKSGSLEGKTTLNEIEPFILVKNEAPLKKEINIYSNFTKTNFNISVLALKNDKVIGIGNNIDGIYLTENNPTSYKLVSYILKDNKLDVNDSNITLTENDLNPDYPITDLWSEDDEEYVIYKITDILNHELDINVNDFDDYKKVRLAELCDNEDDLNTPFCKDYSKAIDKFFALDTNITFKNKYQIDEENCSVNYTVDNKKLNINIICPYGNIKVNITNENNSTFDVYYSANANEVVDGETYPEKLISNYKLIKKDNDFVINNLKEDGNYITWYLNNEDEQYKNKMIDKISYTTTLDYINNKYVVKANTNVNYLKYYSFVDETNKTKEETFTLSFNTKKSQVFNDYNGKIYENPFEYSAIINNIKVSGEKDKNITLNGKNLVVTEDNKYGYHFNMSANAYSYQYDGNGLDSPLIKLSKIVFGNHPILINSDGNFTSIIDLTKEDNNISSYFDVNLSSSKVITNSYTNGDYKGNIIMSLNNSKGSVQFILNNVHFSINNGKVITKFVGNESEIGVIANGLKKFENALDVVDGQEYVATVDNDVVYNDLVFNLQDLIDNSVQGAEKQKVDNALDVLNDYFNETNETYKVSINVNINGVIVVPNKINGTVDVIKDNNNSIDLPPSTPNV